MNAWHAIPEHFPYTGIDEFVVMPNHFHGIIVIYHDNCRGEVSSPASPISMLPISKTKQTTKGGGTPPLRKRTLGQIVAFFKYQSAKQINQTRNTPRCPVWQRNYYEHIIRSEEEMNRIRQYIIDNPAKWAEDGDNPGNIACRGEVSSPTSPTSIPCPPSP
jgi:REP element-mobilizing transposase RayT